MNESNLAMKLEEYNSREELSVVSESAPVGKSLEEIREDARAKAAEHGMTLEESLDEFERISGCKEYADALRTLHGIIF